MATLIAVTALLVYGVFLMLLTARLAFYRRTFPRQSPVLPSISIVIPFRNEARHLDTLCASLAGQDYRGEWEVVLVNDGSNDDFSSPLDRFRNLFGNRLRVVESGCDPAIRLTSKQQALDRGVLAARYEWIIFTDADMSFADNWLSAYADNAGGNVDLIFGHTSIHPAKKSLFGLLQRFQLEFLFATAYAFHISFLPGSCMGNNLLIRKKAYERIGGQSRIGYSIVEDMMLYRTFRKQGLTTAPQEPFDVMAFTDSCKTAVQFYHQMLRWARGGLRGDWGIRIAAMFFTFQNIVFLISLLGVSLNAYAILSYADFILTMVFTACAFRKIHSRESAFFFPVYYCFVLLETVIFCVSFLITPRVSWKSKKI